MPIQMVDLDQRPMAAGEIRRFIERFGLPALIDSEGKAYVDGKLACEATLTCQVVPKARERQPAAAPAPPDTPEAVNPE